MNIEFHAPEGQVKERILRNLRFSLIDLYHSYKNMSRAEVYFREETKKDRLNKVCEIHLVIFGDSFFIHQSSSSYEQSAELALAALKDRIEELLKTQNDLPELIVTSVVV